MWWPCEYLECLLSDSEIQDPVTERWSSDRVVNLITLYAKFVIQLVHSDNLSYMRLSNIINASDHVFPLLR